MNAKAAAETDYQTTAVCTAKHRWLKWVAGVMMSLMLAFLSVVGFAWARADSAVDKAQEAIKVAGEVNAKHDSTLQFIRDGFMRIEQQLRDLRKEKHAK